MSPLYLSIILAALFGALFTYLLVKPKLERLRRLTDRDERGRFVKRERR